MNGKIMTASVAINLKPLDSKPSTIDSEIIVGKDILDLLAGAMYVNPLDVYREYIQNAADAIDQALDANLKFEGQPSVSIRFDHTNRSVTIRDNGISISTGDFFRRLTAIGGSQKRGTALRGFRGVGRLSGLGYCQELTFRGRSEGDTKVSELRWNGRILREQLRNQSFRGSLTELIQSIVTITTLPATSAINYPARFFEVELSKISRLRNDQLLNEDTVRSYLSQVSPAPFSDQFTYGEEISSYLASHGVRQPVKIEINDGKGQVVRNIQNQFTVKVGCHDEVKGVEFVEYKGADGEVAAIGWICDHSYSGALPKKHGLGGIRLRAGNIQIGDEMILAAFFPESRFCSWAIGEIHVISKRILPNGRRDDFEPSNHYSHLQGEFTMLVKQISQRIREKSIQRNRLRTVNNHLLNVQEWVTLASGERLPKVVHSVIREIADEKLKLANVEAGKIQGNPDQQALAISRITEIQSLLEKCEMKHSGKHHAELEKILSAAVKVILASASKPYEGVNLSVRVLNALTSSTCSNAHEIADQP